MYWMNCYDLIGLGQKRKKKIIFDNLLHKIPFGIRILLLTRGPLAFFFSFLKSLQPPGGMLGIIGQEKALQYYGPFTLLKRPVECGLFR